VRRRYRFRSNWQPVASFPGYASENELVRERGVYAADPAFVRCHCGPLAQRFLDAVPQSYWEAAKAAGLETNCDIRLHAMEAGHFPATPGWHCDAAVRETQFAGRGDVSVQANLVGCISSDLDGVSNTEFYLPDFEIESDAQYGNGATLWNEVDAILEAGADEVFQARDGTLYQFDPWTLHRAAPARVRGLRLFFRMSMWIPPSQHQPGLSANEQVYRLLDASSLTSGEYWGANERLLVDGTSFPEARSES
jgi:hypothetical protein